MDRPPRPSHHGMSLANSPGLLGSYRWPVQAHGADVDQRGDTVRITFPGESVEYRTARDRLLEHEIELRRATEAVAAARRELPPGAVVPEDYAFLGRGGDGTPTDVRLSELFAPGKDSLVIYDFMFPRDPGDDRPGPAGGRTALLDS